MHYEHTKLADTVYTFKLDKLNKMNRTTL